jgi:hypothetical protein
MADSSIFSLPDNVYITDATPASSLHSCVLASVLCATSLLTVCYVFIKRYPWETFWLLGLCTYMLYGGFAAFFYYSEAFPRSANSSASVWDMGSDAAGGALGGPGGTMAPLVKVPLRAMAQSAAMVMHTLGMTFLSIGALAAFWPKKAYRPGWDGYTGVTMVRTFG